MLLSLPLIQQGAVPPGQSVAGCRALNLLDCVQYDVMLLANTWMDRAVKIMAGLFAVLLLLEIIATGYSLWMRRSEAADVLQNLGFKLVVMAAILAGFVFIANGDRFFTALTAPEEWSADLAPPPAAGQRTGSSVTALIGMGLRYFVELGFGAFQCNGLPVPDWVRYVIVRLPITGSPCGLWAIVNLPSTVVLIIAGFLALGMFIRLAAELLATLIEGYVVMGAGAVFLGFMAFRGTAPLSEGWLRYLAYICIKLFFVFALCSLVVTVSTDILTAYQTSAVWFFDLQGNHSGPLVPALAVIALSLVVLALLRMSHRGADILTQNLTINIKAWLSKT